MPMVSPETMDLLLTYDWPGNVRELKNTLERLVVRSAEGMPDRVVDAAVRHPLRPPRRRGSCPGEPMAVAAEQQARQLFDRMVRDGAFVLGRGLRAVQQPRP